MTVPVGEVWSGDQEWRRVELHELMPLPDDDPDESLPCCGLLWPTHREYWAHRKATHTWEAPRVTETDDVHMRVQRLREEDGS